MSRLPLPWLDRPGLAGGIDKDGSRAMELLGLGFGSVEFGTVAAHPQAPFSLAALTARLATLPRRAPGGTSMNTGLPAGRAVVGIGLPAGEMPMNIGPPPGRTAVGIGIGLPPGATLAELAAFWLAGLQEASPLADYVSFNLSAQAYRPFLAPEHLPRLAAALATVALGRDRLPRRIPLTLKFPLGDDKLPLPAVAEIAAAAGFDALTTVLPEGEARYSRLAALARSLSSGPVLVALGGIRSAADIAAARAAGAAGVQVHRVFTEQGAGCLTALLGGVPGK